MGLFDVDPESGKMRFNRKIRPGPSSKPVIVFTPEAEAKPHQMIYSDNHVSKKAQLINKKDLKKANVKNKRAETSSEESGSSSGDEDSSDSSSDDATPNFEDMDAKQKYDRVQRLKDPANTLSGNTGSSFFKYKEKVSDEMMIQIKL